MIKWTKNAIDTVSIWFKERGLKNAGWLIAFIVIYLLKGLPKVELLVAAGLVFLGIFIEKNRKSLVEIFKNLKNKTL